jgi:hypothetical protein
MFNLEMELSSYVSCFHLMELLLFIAIIITYDIYLSYMSVLFGIKIFNIFKYDGSMSLISLSLQHICIGGMMAYSILMAICMALPSRNIVLSSSLFVHIHPNSNKCGYTYKLHS